MYFTKKGTRVSFVRGLVNPGIFQHLLSISVVLILRKDIYYLKIGGSKKRLPLVPLYLTSKFFTSVLFTKTNISIQYKEQFFLYINV